MPTEAEADAAALRLAFDRAIATYPQHLATFISKEAEVAFRAWWGQFYETVRDTTAGLLLIAELAKLRSELREAHAHLTGKGEIAWCLTHDAAETELGKAAAALNETVTRLEAEIRRLKGGDVTDKYICGCPVVLAEPKVNLFCAVHFKPLPFDPAAYPHLAPSSTPSS